MSNKIEDLSPLPRTPFNKRRKNSYFKLDKNLTN